MILMMNNVDDYDANDEKSQKRTTMIILDNYLGFTAAGILLQTIVSVVENQPSGYEPWQPFWINIYTTNEYNG